jgi:DNA-binding XRE family transcriptional regulator
MNQVADVDDAVKAPARMLLDLYVTSKREWITVGRYPSLDHELPPRGPGLGVLAALPRLLYQPNKLSHLLLDLSMSTCNNFPMALSHLKEHRKRRGLTQFELAKISGVSRATIAAIETGKRPRPHPPTRERLAKALKVKPEDL